MIGETPARFAGYLILFILPCAILHILFFVLNTAPFQVEQVLYFFDIPPPIFEVEKRPN